MIIYSSRLEVIVCKKSGEKKVLLDYFGHERRHLRDFKREEIKESVHITASLCVS